MRGFGSWRTLWVMALAVGAVALGCSTQTKRQWLTVFFEGVDRTNRVASAEAGRKSARGTNTAAARMAKPAARSVVYHAPVRARKCTECHEGLFSQKLRPNLANICLGCHTAVLTPGRSWHAPAASGDCRVCHEPHQSKRKFLLTQDLSTLCSECHAPEETGAIAAHRGHDQSLCTDCHHPHQAEGKFLLRPPSADTNAPPVPLRPEGPAAAAAITPNASPAPGP